MLVLQNKIKKTNNYGKVMLSFSYVYINTRLYKTQKFGGKKKKI